MGPCSSRDLNSLCQILLRIALDDPGIPNPKKALTNLGQKLSEIDITERTYSEVLRIYIRERNGFDDRLTQILSDNSFQSLIADEKAEILAFLCNDLSNNKRVVESVQTEILFFVKIANSIILFLQRNRPKSRRINRFET